MPCMHRAEGSPVLSVAADARQTRVYVGMEQAAANELKTAGLAWSNFTL